MIEILDRHHGQVTGMFTGDECLAGRSPLQGTELCAVVEFLYSLEHLFSVFGDPFFADRLERVAFNALPATFAPDMWSHQYDQQVNQAQCTINPDHRWTTNGPESNLFGLEPNFGCCTANMHQGWPKFAAHLWMKTRDEGLVATAYAPCRARVRPRAVCRSTVAVDTDYPFRETVAITRPARAGGRAFPAASCACPSWAEGATVRVGDGRRAADGARARCTGSTASGAARRPCSRALPDAAEGDASRYNEAVAVERGPLVYSLAIGEQWTRVNADKPHRDLPHGDFEVRPTTPWNYGLVDRRQRGRRPRCGSRSGPSAIGRSRPRARRRRDGTGPPPAGLEARERLGGRDLAGRHRVGAPWRPRRGTGRRRCAFCPTAARTCASRSSRG